MVRNEKREKGEQIVSVVSYVIVMAFCLILAINVLNNSFVSFDGGWNAQVAANYATTGKYGTTWPKGAVFYKVITTGQTMLLPTSWIFRLCGVSFETIASIPLCFMIGFILALYTFIKRIVAEILLIRYNNSNYILVNVISLIILIIMWSVINFVTYSFDLCGEGATLFFITLGLIGINNYKNKEKCLWLLLTGMAFSGAIITKMVSICFIAVATMILIIYLPQKRKAKDILSLLSGMAISFVALDFIKFQQLGYDLKNYINWWKEYLKYNFGLNQEERYISLGEKILCYENAFQLQRYWGFLALILGIGILICAGLRGVVKKKWCIPIEIFICGLGGVSYLFISIFVSKGGALSKRRLVIHFSFFLLYLIIICMQNLLDIFKQKKVCKRSLVEVANILVKILGVTVICISIKPALGSVGGQLVNLDSRRRQEQQAMLEHVLELPEDVKLVTLDWRFSTAMSTLGDMEIVNINEVDFNSNEEYYYISEDYLVQDIFDIFEFDVVYKKNQDSLQPCIIRLRGWKDSFE